MIFIVHGTMGYTDDADRNYFVYTQNENRGQIIFQSFHHFFVDINECNNISICDQLCQNTAGSYSCSCFEGYEEEVGGSCTNINECLASPCDSNANCTDTQGSYTCSCKVGYRGDGFVCKGAFYYNHYFKNYLPQVKTFLSR